MKALKFEHNSWHMKVAKFGGLWTARYGATETDMCEYVGKFIKGLIGISILTAIVLFFIFCEGHFIAVMMGGILQGVWLFGESVPACLAVAANFVLFSFCMGHWVKAGIVAYNAKKYPNGKPHKIDKPDGFIKNAYKGWKDKYCAKIEIADPFSKTKVMAEDLGTPASAGVQAMTEVMSNMEPLPITPLSEIDKALDEVESGLDKLEGKNEPQSPS